MPRPDWQPAARVAFDAAGAVKMGVSGRPLRPASPVGVGSPHKPQCSPSPGNDRVPRLCLRATVRGRQLAGGFLLRLPLADAIPKALATGCGALRVGLILSPWWIGSSRALPRGASVLGSRNARTVKKRQAAGDFILRYLLAARDCPHGKTNTNPPRKLSCAEYIRESRGIVPGEGAHE